MFKTIKYDAIKFNFISVENKISNLLSKNNNIYNNPMKLGLIKFFSTKSKDNLPNLSTSENSRDFFESNFTISKPPEHISTVNKYFI